jgi:glucosamine--fructose-6-phosphate aminotransferase (isomerizing)
MPRTASASRMVAELREAPHALRRQAQAIAAPLGALIERLDRRPPDVVVTCARGSSAHAATFAKHVIERHLGIPVSAAAPNIASVYHRRLHLSGQLLLAVSQSGASEDLIETATVARQAGALTAALVNNVDSPLAEACEFVLPLSAGPEHSIAATKTFLASLAAVLRLGAAWRGDEAMRLACHRLPARLERAAELDWSTALAPLSQTNSLVTIGRGPSLAIAREAALKLKEACGVHAEAFSSAEICHGPIALVSRNYPILAFAPNDECAPGFAALTTDLRNKGARVFVAWPGKNDLHTLPVLDPEQAEADAICLIQSFYAFLPALAERRGSNVDHPRHLQKVTRTR